MYDIHNPNIYNPGYCYLYIYNPGCTITQPQYLQPRILLPEYQVSLMLAAIDSRNKTEHEKHVLKDVNALLEEVMSLTNDDVTN